MSPYRPLPVARPELVFCKDCRHSECNSTHERCHAPAADSDPIEGFGSPRVRNAKLDCALFERRPWWRFR